MITQQTPPTPAQRLAAKIRARTNDTRDILDLLHDIAQGEHDATEHDKLNATGILFDRGYGKCPKQPPVLSHVEACPEPSRRGPASTDPAPETDDNDAAATRESPPAVTHEEPGSPRLVTQLDDSLHEALGPAPSPCPEPVEGARPEVEGADTPTRHSRESGNPESYDVSHSSEQENPDPFDDPSSIQSIIRDHIISITNDGDTLIDVLMDIAWPDDPDACPEPEPALSKSEGGRRVKPFHRQKAGKMLLDRGAGRDLTPIITAVQPQFELSQNDEDYPDYPPGYVFDPTKDCIYCSQSLNMPEGHEGEHRFDHEGLAKALEEIQQKLDEQGITLDPNPPEFDYPISSPSKKWVANNIDLVREEAAKFEEELKLRIERQKAWPAIEERRRKKLAQIYPSHSDDDDPPDP